MKNTLSKVLFIAEKLQTNIKALKTCSEYLKFL